MNAVNARWRRSNIVKLWRKSKVSAITDLVLFLIVLFYAWIIIAYQISNDLKAGVGSRAAAIMSMVVADLARVSDAEKIDEILNRLKSIQEDTEGKCDAWTFNTRIRGRLRVCRVQARQDPAQRDRNL